MQAFANISSSACFVRMRWRAEPSDSHVIVSSSQLQLGYSAPDNSYVAAEAVTSETTLSRMNISGYIEHATIFS